MEPSVTCSGPEPRGDGGVESAYYVRVRGGVEWFCNAKGRLPGDGRIVVAGNCAYRRSFGPIGFSSCGAVIRGRIQADNFAGPLSGPAASKRTRYVMPLFSPARPRGAVFSLVLFPVLLVTGCHSKSAATPENFIKGLNAHFSDHPDCLFTPAPRFPYETSDPTETKQMKALVDSKLLSAEAEPSIRVSRYTPTDIGKRYAPRFCYGRRVVTAIDSSTPPAQANGFTETKVTYRYTMTDVPVWAKSEETQSAFPKLKSALSGESTGEATLAGTMVGWQVPD